MPHRGRRRGLAGSGPGCGNLVEAGVAGGTGGGGRPPCVRQRPAQGDRGPAAYDGVGGARGFGGPLLQGGVRLAHDDLGRLLRPDIGVRTGAVESNQLLAQLLDRVLRPLLGAWAEREWSFWSSKEGRRCLCG